MTLTNFMDIAPPKPALVFILDGVRPDLLRAATRGGETPNLAAFAEACETAQDVVPVFPGIKPVATAAVATGEAPDRSGIVGHAWYGKSEDQAGISGAMTGTVLIGEIERHAV